MGNSFLDIKQIGSVLPSRTGVVKRAEGRKASLLSSRFFPFLPNTDPNKFEGFLNAAGIEAIAKEIIACGQVEGYTVILERIGASTGNSPVWAIKISPRNEKRAPAYFSAGHHGDEYAGPQANLHLLKLILHELKVGGSGVRSLLGDRTMVFIPLATPDAAKLDDQGNLPSGNSFSMGTIVAANGFVVNSNIYLTYEGRIQPGAEMILQYLEKIGVPEIVFDMHETGSVNIDERRKNRYIFVPLQVSSIQISETTLRPSYTMGVRRETINKALQLYGEDVSALIINGKPIEKFSRRDQKIMGFSEYWKMRGAKSCFTIETPMKEEAFQVGDRVCLHMLAVQEAMFEMALS